MAAIEDFKLSICSSMICFNGFSEVFESLPDFLAFSFSASSSFWIAAISARRRNTSGCFSLQRIELLLAQLNLLIGRQVIHLRFGLPRLGAHRHGSIGFEQLFLQASKPLL